MNIHSFNDRRVVLLKLLCAYQLPGDLTKMQILTSEVFGGTLRFCISKSSQVNA